MEPGFLIGEDDAARLAAMLTSFECGKLGAVPVPPVNPASADQQAVIFAKVTSGTPSYSYYYPAKRVYRHNGDWVEAEAIWLRALNGEALVVDRYYTGRFWGSSPTLDPSPIYAADVPPPANQIRYSAIVRPTFQNFLYPRFWHGIILDLYTTTPYNAVSPWWFGTYGAYIINLNAMVPYHDTFQPLAAGKNYIGAYVGMFAGGPYPIYAVYDYQAPPTGAGTGGVSGTEPIV